MKAAIYGGPRSIELETTLDHIREAYEAMDQRRATKALLRIGTR